MRTLAVLCLSACLLALAGCSGMKAAGKWTAAAQDGGSLVLNGDGTGTLSGGLGGDEQVKWTEDGQNLKLFKSTDDPSKATPLITGTLSDDQKQLTLSIGAAEGINATMTFTRQG